MGTKLLIEEYLANGGTITKLPTGTAEGALDLGRKDAIQGRNSNNNEEDE